MPGNVNSESDAVKALLGGKYDVKLSLPYLIELNAAFQNDPAAYFDQLREDGDLDEVDSLDPKEFRKSLEVLSSYAKDVSGMKAESEYTYDADTVRQAVSYLQENAETLKTETEALLRGEKESKLDIDLPDQLDLPGIVDLGPDEGEEQQKQALESFSGLLSRYGTMVDKVTAAVKARQEVVAAFEEAKAKEAEQPEAAPQEQKEEKQPEPVFDPGKALAEGCYDVKLSLPYLMEMNKALKEDPAAQFDQLREDGDLDELDSLDPKEFRKSLQVLSAYVRDVSGMKAESEYAYDTETVKNAVSYLQQNTETLKKETDELISGEKKNKFDIELPDQLDLPGIVDLGPDEGEEQQKQARKDFGQMLSYCGTMVEQVTAAVEKRHAQEAAFAEAKAKEAEKPEAKAEQPEAVPQEQKEEKQPEAKAEQPEAQKVLQPGSQAAQSEQQAEKQPEQAARSEAESKEQPEQAKASEEAPVNYNKPDKRPNEATGPATEQDFVRERLGDFLKTLESTGSRFFNSTPYRHMIRDLKKAIAEGKVDKALKSVSDYVKARGETARITSSGRKRLETAKELLSFMSAAKGRSGPYLNALSEYLEAKKPKKAKEDDDWSYSPSASRKAPETAPKAPVKAPEAGQNAKAAPEDSLKPKVLGTGNALEYNPETNSYVRFDSTAMTPEQERLQRLKIQNGGRELTAQQLLYVKRLARTEEGKKSLQDLNASSARAAAGLYKADMLEYQQTREKKEVAELIGKTARAVGADKLSDKVVQNLTDYYRQAKNAEALLQEECASQKGEFDALEEVSAVVGYASFVRNLDKGIVDPKDIEILDADNFLTQKAKLSGGAQKWVMDGELHDADYYRAHVLDEKGREESAILFGNAYRKKQELLEKVLEDAPKTKPQASVNRPQASAETKAEQEDKAVSHQALKQEAPEEKKDGKEVEQQELPKEDPKVKPQEPVKDKPEEPAKDKPEKAREAEPKQKKTEKDGKAADISGYKPDTDDLMLRDTLYKAAKALNTSTLDPTVEKNIADFYYQAKGSRDTLAKKCATEPGSFDATREAAAIVSFEAFRQNLESGQINAMDAKLLSSKQFMKQKLELSRTTQNSIMSFSGKSGRFYEKFLLDEKGLETTAAMHGRSWNQRSERYEELLSDPLAKKEMEEKTANRDTLTKDMKAPVKDAYSKANQFSK